MTLLPCASSARARWSTSNADSIPIRVMRSAMFMCLSRYWFGRLDANERSVVLFGQHIHVSVGTLSHVADALAELAQHRLTPDFFPLVVELDALQLTGSRRLTLPQSADEQAALPSSEAIAGVERHARERNRRNPHDVRLLHALAHRLIRHARSRIAAPLTDHRPSVVLAGLNDVDLVAAVWPLLARPDLSCLRIHGEAKLIAMTECIDL